MNFDLVDFAIWAAGAIIVTGVLQSLKKLWKKAPAIVWKVASMVMAAVAGYAYALKIGNARSVVWFALGIYATTELFYQAIVKRATNTITGSSAKQ